MEYFLFGGAVNVGKTEAIHRLADDLLLTGRFHVLVGTIPAVINQDFLVMLDGTDIHGNAIKIIINSAADEEQNIDDLRNFKNSNGHYDIIISAIRSEGYDIRQYFINQLRINLNNEIEFPLASVPDKYVDTNIVRQWYYTRVDDISHRLLHFYFNLL